MKKFILVMISWSFFASASFLSKDLKIDQNELDKIARESYKYLFPLVMMDITQRKFSNTPYPEHKKGVPINVFNHMRQFPPLDYKDVVRPNFDTLYSTAFIDVSKEPPFFQYLMKVDTT